MEKQRGATIVVRVPVEVKEELNKLGLLSDVVNRMLLNGLKNEKRKKKNVVKG